MDYLLISGIQHFVFCKRQWGLIYIEKIWKENFKTFKGNEFHKDIFFTENLVEDLKLILQKSF